MSASYEIFRGTNQQYYFRLKAPNNGKRSYNTKW